MNFIYSTWERKKVEMPVDGSRAEYFRQKALYAREKGRAAKDPLAL